MADAPAPRAPPDVRPLATLEWAYRYGFTLIAGITLLAVVLYYTHVLDERSYDNALQLQQINAKMDALQAQMNRIELKLERGDGR